MNIELYDRDIKLISNNVKMGGGSHTALEVALARKCIKLQKAMHEMNERQQRYFDALWSMQCTLDRHAGERIKQRKEKEL